MLGLCNGKKEDIRVLPLIFNSDKEMMCRFVRGLADTDFYLKFKTRYKKRNYYPIIIGNFKSGEFVKQLKQLFGNLGFHSHIEKRKKYDKTKNKYYYSSTVNIVGKKNLQKWMKEIGFANKKHLTRYDIWEKQGFLLPIQIQKKREFILNKK